MNRADAFPLLNEYVAAPTLVRHCLSGGAARRAYGPQRGGEEENWGPVGLLHHFVYESWPTPPDHPLKGSEILRGRVYSEEIITAILSHADYLSDRYP